MLKSMLVNRFSNLAFAGLAAEPPANQKPGWKFLLLCNPSPGVITTVPARYRDMSESKNYYITIVPWHQAVHPTTATAGLFGISEGNLTLSMISQPSQKRFSGTVFICEYKYHSWNITDLPFSLNWKIRLLGWAHLFLDRWLYAWIRKQLICSKLKCVLSPHPILNNTEISSHKEITLPVIHTAQIHCNIGIVNQT